MYQCWFNKGTMFYVLSFDKCATVKYGGIETKIISEETETGIYMRTPRPSLKPSCESVIIPNKKLT